MTICVLVKVHDCLVFAADSASSLQATTPTGDHVVIKVFEHGNKVFNLYKGLPICAMTCGMGNFGDSSIATLAKDLRLELAKVGGPYYIDRASYTMKDVADRAFEFFFTNKYSGLENKPTGNHSFEFFVGGYGTAADKSEVWSVQIANGLCSGPVQVGPPDLIGVHAAGQPDAVNRLALGYSSGVTEALLAAGVDQAVLPQLMAAIAEKTQATIVYPSMPVQDAIRLADFLVDTTKGFVSFLPGADTVGGDTDVAVVTKHEGFKWIRRKHYYRRELNPLETDHA